MKKTSLIAIGLIASALCFQSCKKIQELTGTITPARNVEGTWKTPFAVKFYLSTDKCGGFVRYADQDQKLTWLVTAISDNEVNIFSSASYKGSFNIYNICSQQPVPVSYDVSSMTGVVSSSQMDLYVGTTKVGSMSFTSNNLAGYYDHQTCGSYGCNGLSTNSGTLILTR
jgi:hypothetical protein